MKLELVRFQPQDIDTVWAIQREAYRPLYETYQDDETSPWLESRALLLEKYTRPGVAGYLFLADGQPVGAVRIIIDAENRRARVSGLGVLPAWQGRGIAQEALRRIERLHPEAAHWSLGTILQEPKNCHLYEKLGYRRYGELKPVNEKMTLVFYQKDQPAQG